MQTWFGPRVKVFYVSVSCLEGWWLLPDCWLDQRLAVSARCIHCTRVSSIHSTPNSFTITIAVIASQTWFSHHVKVFYMSISCLEGGWLLLDCWLDQRLAVSARCICCTHVSSIHSTSNSFTITIAVMASQTWFGLRVKVFYVSVSCLEGWWLLPDCWLDQRLAVSARCIHCTRVSSIHFYTKLIHNYNRCDCIANMIRALCESVLC